MSASRPRAIQDSLTVTLIAPERDASGAPRRTSRAAPAPTACRAKLRALAMRVRKRSIMGDPGAVLCALLCQGMHNPRRGIKDRQAGAGWLRSILDSAGSNSAWTRRGRDWIGGGSRSSRWRPDPRRCCLPRRSRRSGPRGRSPDLLDGFVALPGTKAAQVDVGDGAKAWRAAHAADAGAVLRQLLQDVRARDLPAGGGGGPAVPRRAARPSTTRSARPAAPCSST